MRVALNGWFLNSPSTGSGQYLRHLAKALVAAAGDTGTVPLVIAPQAGPPFDVPVRLAQPLLRGNVGKVQFEQITFPRACRRDGQVAHVPYFGPPLFPQVPTVVTIHDLIPLVLPEYRRSPAVRLYTRLAAASARRAQMVIADSEASRRDIIAHLGISPERVRVIYLAADSLCRPVDEPAVKARLRAKYHLPERFVLYLGGFDVRKNVRTIIAAFSTLEQCHRAGWKLVIAGLPPVTDTPFLPDPHVGASSAVLFIGPVEEEDKPALYSSARAFLFPSSYEGFGLPPLEAMACGTPVLCANTSSLPEVVGEGGVLLDPFDVAAWGQALGAVIDDDSRWGALRARGLAQSARFSWEQAARETLEVYRSAVGPFDK